MAEMELLSSGHGLLEGPLFEPGQGLLFSDTLKGGVKRLRADGALEEVVAHRKGMGGLARHAAGGLVVSGRTVAYKPPDGGATRTLIPDDPERGIRGFNDLVTDAAGRVYVGSLAFSPFGGDSPKPAFLHLVDLDGSTRVVAEDVLLTNGLGFSPDGSRLYHSDSLRHAVMVYDVLANGDVRNRRVFAAIEPGIPDGLAVAEDGSVWVALAHGGAVAGFAPDGREIARLALPVPMVTSLCFGGADWQTLYVVTGPDGAPQELGGCVYRLRAPTRGRPRPLARVRLPEE